MNESRDHSNSNTGRGGGDGQPLPPREPAETPPSPTELMAEVTRGQWDDYVTNFQPVILDTIKQVTDKNRINELANSAGAETRQSFAASLGAQSRALGRASVQLSTRQQKDAKSDTGFNRATAIANTENQTRNKVRDQNTAVISDLVAQGRGIQKSSMEGLNAAANAETQRLQAGKALAADQRQSTMASIATGAGIGATFGPGGAAIGAGVGFLASIF